MVQPLDLQTIFVNYFAGNAEIFVFLAFAVFAFLAAKFRMPSMVFMVIFTAFATSMAFIYPELWVYIVIFVGVFVFSLIVKWWKG